MGSRMIRVLWFGLVTTVGAASCSQSASQSSPPAASAPPADPPHRFADAEKWAQRFEDPGRDEWQEPDVVIALAATAPTDKVADIGAATGYFPVRFARAVPQGFVYGVDVEQSMVDYLNARAEREGIENLRALRCTPDDPQLPEPVDIIFICDTYHHIGDRVAYFSRLKDKLRPGGRLVIVDYYKRELPVGPPPAHKVAADTVEQEMAAAGYRLILRDETLRYQYVLIFGAD